jgi:hypothetical protein
VITSHQASALRSLFYCLFGSFTFATILIITFKPVFSTGWTG